MSAAYIFDTECTDLKDPEIIEAAWYRLPPVPGGPFHAPPMNTFCDRYKPTKKISYGAMAVHHILESDLQDCQPCSKFRLPVDVAYIVGHNIDHDWKCARYPEDVQRICTLAMSRELWPGIDSYSQSALLYMLFGASARDMVKNAHSALVDVSNNLSLLKKILEACRERGLVFDSWEDVWKFSEKCRMPKVMYFGKYEGVAISDLPKDYVGWLYRQEWLSTDHPYLKLALEKL